MLIIKILLITGLFVLILELLQRIYYSWYQQIENFNERIKKKIDGYDQRMTIANNDLLNGGITIHDLNIKIVIPTKIHFIFLNYLEKQLLMNWVDQAVYIRKTLFKSKFARAVFLKNVIKKLGKVKGQGDFKCNLENIPK